MEISEEIYLLNDDLFRVGNSRSPRLDNVRERDIEIIEREGEYGTEYFRNSYYY
ncbi:hypothetical protein QUF72_04145 [Desulfobacterales bacterium HSG2]|nr:hypothetical protein [Desulfobacterales bacterium HSG2]